MMNRISVVLAELCLLASAGVVRAAPNRDVLWEIVSNCLASDVGPNYCRNCPFPLLPYLASCMDPSGQSPAAVCRETTEVWDQAEDFVAIRDKKMCGCPDDFVHGLAIPLRKVTGIEDPTKPEGIWPFAWKEAVRKIGAANKDSILIAVNSPAQRTQDQLHIHLARLDEGTRRKILASGPVRVSDLSGVWAVAARHAREQKLAADGYGVAVIRDPAGEGFLVATLAQSLEKVFGTFSCGSF